MFHCMSCAEQNSRYLFLLTNIFDSIYTLGVACTTVDQNLIAGHRSFRATYLQNSEENWSKT